MNLKADVQGFDLSGCSAAVLGCGGLGTNISVHLCGAGIGKLVLFDFDKVEMRNLNRQFFYTPQDIGKPKAALLAERLSAFAPDVNIQAWERKIETEHDLHEAENCDVLLLAADNVRARQIGWQFCVSRGIPCINGSIDGFYGTVYTALPGKTSDLETAGCLVQPPRKSRSVSATAGVIGALQAQCAIDLLLQSADHGGILYCYDHGEIHALKLKQTENPTKGADAF